MSTRVFRSSRPPKKIHLLNPRSFCLVALHRTVTSIRRQVRRCSLRSASISVFREPLPAASILSTSSARSPGPAPRHKSETPSQIVKRESRFPLPVNVSSPIHIRLPPTLPAPLADLPLKLPKRFQHASTRAAIRPRQNAPQSGRAEWKDHTQPRRPAIPTLHKTTGVRKGHHLPARTASAAIVI